MKVKVSPSLKGELFIRSKNKTYKSGTNIQMSDEEFYDSFTQSLVSKGWIVPLEDYAKESVKVVRMRSNKNNPIVFKVINRAINPNEVFYVPIEHFGDSQIQHALEKGHIIKEENTVIEKTPSLADQTKVVSAEAKGKTVKRVAKEPSNAIKENKIIKEAKVVKVSKPETKKQTRTSSKEPENAYVYRPADVEVNEPPQPAAEIVDDIFVDFDNNKDEISFVDEEQQNDRLSQLKRRLAENNEEIE